MSQKIQRIIAGVCVLLSTCVLLVLARQQFYDESYEHPGRQTVPPVPTEAPVRVTDDPEPEVTRDPVQTRFDAMTLEEQVGQLFLVRYDESDAEREMLQYHPGGYLLFAKDFKNESPASMQYQLKNLQDKSKTPLIYAVDEEGGDVVRASYYSGFREEPFESPQELIARGGVEKTQEDAMDKALFLRDLGLNVNLGPVCDVATDPESYIYSRTAGLDAAGTAEYVFGVVSAAQNYGVGAVLKHFPGYGNNADTHNGGATDERSLTELRQSDFLPFEAGIQAGAGAVMVSHNTVTAIDPEKPASLSDKVYTLLRSELGFQGVAITDDLDMGALKGYSDGEAAVLAIQAGGDLLIAADFQTQFEAVLTAVQEGEISQARLEEAVKRVLKWKADLGLLR